MIIICGFLLWSNYFGGYFSIEWFVYAQTAAYLVTAIVALISVLYKSGKLKLNWNVPFFIMIMKKSMPFALLVLLMSFYNRIDPVLIERLLPGKLGEIQSGIYAQAFRLLDAGQNFAFLFSVLLLPLFARMIKEQKPISELLKLSFSIIISGSLIIAITSAFYNKEIMLLLYTRFEGETHQQFFVRIDESAAIFRLLMFSFVAISSNYIFATLLTANNNLKVLNKVAFTGLLINLVLNLILIPRYHAFGSAVASLGTQATTAVLHILMAKKLLRLKVNGRIIVNLGGFIILVVLTGFALRYLNSIDWKISMGIMLAAGLIIAFVFRFLNVKEFLRILKSE
jgi:O-antigen/teichoic acid export membrane protein